MIPLGQLKSRAKSQELRAKNQESRAKSQEPRIKSQEQNSQINPKRS